MSQKDTGSENFFDYVKEGIGLSRKDTKQDNDQEKTFEHDFLTELLSETPQSVPKKAVQPKSKTKAKKEHDFLTELISETPQSVPKKAVKPKSKTKPKKEHGFLTELISETKSKTKPCPCCQKIRKFTILEKILIPVVALLCAAFISLLVYDLYFNIESVTTESVHGTAVLEENVSMVDLDDQDSEAYKAIHEKYQKALAESLTKKMPGFRKVNIMKMRPGSLILDFDIEVDRSQNPEVCNEVGSFMGDLRKKGLKVDGKKVNSLGTYTGEPADQKLSEFCTNILPGTGHLKFGYDITLYDTFDRYMKSRLRPVIKYECYHGETLTYNQKTYQKPSAVKDHQSTPGGSLNARSKLIQTMTDVQDAFSISGGVSFGYGPISGSFSVAYAQMQQKISKSEEKFTRSEIVDIRAKVLLRPPHALTLDDDFAADLKALPGIYNKENNESREAYEDIINKYGTHYVERATLGGRMTQETSMNYNFLSTASRRTFEVGASIMLENATNFIKIEYGYKQEDISSAEEIRRDSSINVQYHGGSKDFGHENKIIDWQPTIAADPVFIDVEFKPIYDLIADPEKKFQLENAIRDIKGWYNGYSDSGGFLDTGYGQPCRRFNDCKMDVFTIPAYHPEINQMADIFRMTGDCEKKVCVCTHFYPSTYSISQKECVSKCDKYHPSKFIAHPGEGFYIPGQGLHTYLDDANPAECAAECTTKWPTSCRSFVYFKNERKCQFFDFIAPKVHYVDHFEYSLNGTACDIYDKQKVYAIYYNNYLIPAKTIQIKKYALIDRGEVYGKDLGLDLDLYKRACQ